MCYMVKIKNMGKLFFFMALISLNMNLISQDSAIENEFSCLKSYFGGLSSGSIKKSTAINIDYVTTSDSLKIKVIKFTMLTYINGSPMMLRSSSNKINSMMKSTINKIPKGGTLIFTDFYVKGKNNTDVKLNSNIVLRII
jgi:hypothetical protein